MLEGQAFPCTYPQSVRPFPSLLGRWVLRIRDTASKKSIDIIIHDNEVFEHHGARQEHDAGIV